MSYKDFFKRFYDIEYLYENQRFIRQLEISFFEYRIDFLVISTFKSRENS
jgi:hypothetical protein